MLIFLMTLAGALLLVGCGSVARSGGSRLMGSTNHSPAAVSRALAGQWHTVEVKPRRDHQIPTWQKFNPIWWLQNIDDPHPPEWYRPGGRGREFTWSMRNPFHNFTFYVIGIADKRHERSGRYPLMHRNPNNGLHFSASRYKFIWLPFIAYNRSKFDSYLGWRPRGNFGIKININPQKRNAKSDVPKPEPSAAGKP